MAAAAAANGAGAAAARHGIGGAMHLWRKRRLNGIAAAGQSINGGGMARLKESSWRGETAA